MMMFSDSVIQLGDISDFLSSQFTQEIRTTLVFKVLSRFFGNGSLLVFNMLRSKGLLADVKLVVWAW